MTTHRALPLLAVITGGLIAGAFDTLHACIAYGLCDVTPFRYLQAIASGVMGVAAYRGGFGPAGVGLLLYSFVLGAAAALFHATSRKQGWLFKHALGVGLLCGACVFSLINVIVVPLAAVADRADSGTVGRCVEFDGPHGIRWSPIRLA
ncbi:MAG: hypothetical protein ACR2GP_14805 [Burkholderiaceae bacterium]